MKANSLHSEEPSHRPGQFDRMQSGHGAASSGPNPEVTSQVKSLFRAKSQAREDPRILIITDDDRLAKELAFVFRQAGLPAEHAPHMAEGREAARSGRFQVVATTPQLKDGSWKQLVGITRYYRCSFALILLAKTYDPRQRSQAMEEGALDVLDAFAELPRIPEAARRALWIEYLTGACPNMEAPTF